MESRTFSVIRSTLFSPSILRTRLLYFKKLDSGEHSYLHERPNQFEIGQPSNAPCMRRSRTPRGPTPPGGTSPPPMHENVATTDADRVSELVHEYTGHHKTRVTGVILCLTNDGWPMTPTNFIQRSGYLIDIVVLVLLEFCSADLSDR